MAGLLHLGVGLAYKKVTPSVHAGILLALSYGIDIIFGFFFLLGLEGIPAEGEPNVSLYSHGLFMALIWTGLTAFLIYQVTKDGKLTGLLTLLFYSHWLIDFISQPMTAVFPHDTGLTIFFAESPLIGLGAWSTQLGMIIGEYVGTAICLVIYLHTIYKMRSTRLNKEEIT